MAEVKALLFDFDSGKVCINYTDIGVGSRGVPVHIPSLDSKCNFTALTAIYNDEKMGRSKQTRPVEIFDNPGTATEFLEGLYKDDIISLQFSDGGGGEFMLPSCNYTDITDKEILGKEPITEQYLQDEGIWANNGLRIINVTIKNFPNGIKPDKYSLTLSLRDGTELRPKLVFGNTSTAYPIRDFTFLENEKTIKSDIYLDTNLLGGYFKVIYCNRNHHFF